MDAKIIRKVLDKFLKEEVHEDLKKEFPFKPSDFGIQEEAPTPGSDIILDSLGEMPQPNPAIVQTAQATPNVMSTGLTPTEQALLSEEERMIALRNRGLA